MKLTTEQLRLAARGAVRIADEDGAVHFYRFTEAQDEMYLARKRDFWLKARASSGIRLSFRTDSPTLTLKVRAAHGASREWFVFEIRADGKTVGTLSNVPPMTNGTSDTGSHPLGEFSGEFRLGAGEKTVEIDFPWSVDGAVTECSLADDASFAPSARPAKRFLYYGDSITQGYDTAVPRLGLSFQVGEAFDAEVINRAIGGEIFVPSLAALGDDFMPDAILCAYGTNDWSSRKPDDFEARCFGFLEALRRTYPTSKIVALTPIWRADWDSKRTPIGAFVNIADCIRRAAAQYGGIEVIDAFSFVPPDPALFSDRRLHPNDDGFRYYGMNLTAALREVL